MGLTSIIESAITPFIHETARVIKYKVQDRRAQRLLHDEAGSDQVTKGVMILTELARSYPQQRQDLVDRIQAFMRRRFPQNESQGSPRKSPEPDAPVPAPSPLAASVGFALRSITALPRLDENGQPLYLDFHQMRVENVDLSGINFKDVTLWGCQFHNVMLRKANLENADLGGTVFVNCSLEFANMRNAKICGSFMDERPTVFERTRLWRATLHEADVEIFRYTPADRESADVWGHLIHKQER